MLIITLDANGLRNYIIKHSNNNLIFEYVQSINDYTIASHQTFDDIPKDIQHLRFRKYNNEAVPSIDFSNYRFANLTAITVAEGSLNHIRELIIDGLERLESVKIGERCFSIDGEEECNDGVCRITNCPNLRQLEIGNESFRDFKSFELSNINSLQSIKFGNWCFTRVCEFVIDGLPNLKNVNIGKYCFRIENKECNDGLCRITNCPNLRQLKIGNWSFTNYKSFKLFNVKSLHSINFGNECFQKVCELVIDGLENLKSLKIGRDCFRLDYYNRNEGVCRITNCPNLRQLEIGNKSFRDFKSFELFNVNSIQSIKFGQWCFYYADCSLKGE